MRNGRSSRSCAMRAARPRKRFSTITGWIWENARRSTSTFCSRACERMGLIGILIALGLLIWLAYRGWSILLLAPAAAILAAGVADGQGDDLSGQTRSQVGLPAAPEIRRAGERVSQLASRAGGAALQPATSLARRRVNS